MQGWIAVDLDGTLAEYYGWPVDGSIGEPIPAMVERVKVWLAGGKDVRIFTARVWPLGLQRFHNDGLAQRSADAEFQLVRVEVWCREHLGQVLPVTCIKDFGMIELWDDRAVQVIPNTGKPIAEGKCRCPV